MRHFFLHAIHAVLHLSWTLAVSCFGGDFWGAGWTGLRICVGDPIHAVRGDSDCGPCNRLVSDLRSYTRGHNWRVDLAEFTDGQPNDIAIVRAAKDQPTPYTEVVVNGTVTRTVSGYRGDVEQEVIRLCPLPITRVTRPSVKTDIRVMRATGPTWTWPGDLRTHLANEHGYSLAWLNTLTTAELVALHDNSHNAKPAVRYVQAPVAYRTVAPAYYSPPTYYRSSGVQAFGVPLFGTYQSGSMCPPGVRCP